MGGSADGLMGRTLRRPPIRPAHLPIAQLSRSRIIAVHLGS
jgi:hypothetical protein